MIQFVQQHYVAIGMASYWIYSAALSTMPEPGPNAKPGYLWIYRFLHTIAGNITTVLATKIPGVKQ